MRHGRNRVRGARPWLAAISVALACGGAPREPEAIVPGGESDIALDGSNVQPSPVAIADPRSDEAIVIALRSIPAGLDPLTDLDPWAARVAEDAVFEGLTRRRFDAAPWAEPALADTCVLHPESAPRDAYCHLPADRSFHDGSAVTIDDVVYSLEHWLDPRRGMLRLRHGLSALRRVEVVDRPPPGTNVGAPDPGRWIRVSSEIADPLLLERIAELYVVPRAAHRASASRFARAPIGTGPMRVVEYASDRLVLEATGPTAPEVARKIVLLQIRDGAAALTGLRRGEVHVVASVAPAHVPAELAKPGMATRFSAWVLSPPRFDLLLYNVRRAPVAGPRMRAALDAALPRAQLAADAGGLPGRLIAAPVDLHAPTEVDVAVLEAADAAAHMGMGGLPVPLLPEADESGRQIAGTLLDELGWTIERGLRRRANNHLRLVLMWTGAAGPGRATADAVRDTWRSIGIHVPYATASWSYLMGPLRRGEFDLALGRLAEHSDADLYPYFHSKGELNISGIADPELDAALDGYRRARTSAERRAEQERIAARLSALRPVSVLRAPQQLLVASRRIAQLRFVDDLPQLSGLVLLPPRDWELGPR